MGKGIVRELQRMIDGMSATGQGRYALNLSAYKNELLTNGHRPPMPTKALNQRQKRKRARQVR